MINSDIGHLFELVYALMRAEASNDILKALLHQLITVFKVEGASIALLDDEKKKLNFFIQAGKSKRPVFQVEIGVGIAGRVAQTGQSMKVNDVKQSPYFFQKVDKHTGFHTRSILCAPIMKDKKLIGTLQILNKKDAKAFTIEEQDILEIIGKVSGLALHRSYERQQLKNLESIVHLELSNRYTLIPSLCPVMQAQYAVLKRAAKSQANIMILGESGVGKEVAARAIHQWSHRNQTSFVAVNCSAISHHLLESEFFGHEKGAFTGANERKKGRFELADKGTLFLDEIGDLSLELQTKLLRVIQDKEFQRVGGNETIYSDFRLIVATHKDLKAMVAEKLFREDLYYRIHVISVVLPPLRARTVDIPILAQHFAQKIAKSLKVPMPILSDELISVLQNYPWPGNIRELANIIERAIVLSSDSIIKVDTLPQDIRNESTHNLKRFDPISHESSPLGLNINHQTDAISPLHFDYPSISDLQLKDQVQVFKKHVVMNALRMNDNHQADSADALGIRASNLSRLMKDLGLRS
jgi:Nif-specific regulatory protein